MGIGGYLTSTARVEKVIGARAGLKFVAPKTRRSRLYRTLGVEDVTTGAESTRLTFKDATCAVLADITVGKPKENIVGLDRSVLYMRFPGGERA
jgi:hypothetical protein